MHARQCIAALCLVAPLALGMVLGGCDTSAPLYVDEGKPTGVLEPTEVSGELRFAAVGAGYLHTCATTVQGKVYCWGRNEYGETGDFEGLERCSWSGHEDDPGTPCSGEPRPITDAPPLPVLGGGSRHACGLDAEHQAWCWGFGLGGQLGDGTNTSRTSAAPVAGTFDLVQLALATETTGSCALDADGNLYCWGPLYRLAMGATGLDTPTQLFAQQSFEAVDLSQLNACGLTQGAAWCWGSNWYGQLGIGGATGQDGGLEGSDTPLEVSGGHVFTQVAVSLSHVCALRIDGAVYCWGSDPTGTGSYATEPVAVGGPAFVNLEAGGHHTCGLTGTGEAWCWGVNAYGELGDGTQDDRPGPTPVRAPTGVVFERLSLGGAHTCGLATDGRLFCWGYNEFGQVGQPPE